MARLSRSSQPALELPGRSLVPPAWLRLSVRAQLCAFLGGALLVRLLTLGLYPLTDTTEARYGEIARKMVETGHWLVPQLDYGVPFWGKPPLSFWLTATSFKLLGINEFAARTPSFLLGVAICGLAYVLASRRRGMDYGLRACVVIATCILMMVSAGGVMTDPAMVFGTTLSMVAFWLAMAGDSRGWGYAFFIGVAIGLLAKGPVALVLTVLPIGAWAVLTGRCNEVWRRMPWGAGALLTVLLVVPWYWAAEVRYPGFLNYFLIGEHWQRFTISGWKGDLYGSGHAYARGTIWLYAFLGTLPWSPWVVWQLIRRKAAVSVSPLRSGDGWVLYLVCWMLSPLVFFTMARNILPTYVLPGLIGFGLLTAEVWEQRKSGESAGFPLMLALVAPVVTVIIVLVIWPRLGFDSQREIVASYRAARHSDQPLVYFMQRPYSAEFYSHGTARKVGSVEELRSALAQEKRAFVAMRAGQLEQLPNDLRVRLEVVKSHTGEFMLVQLPPPAKLLAHHPDTPQP